MIIIITTMKIVITITQAGTTCGDFFSHSSYDKFFGTFATKVPYLTFCDKMREFLI